MCVCVCVGGGGGGGVMILKVVGVPLEASESYPFPDML